MRSERQRNDLVRSCPTPCECVVRIAVQATLRRFDVCPLVAGRRERETRGANNARDRTELMITGLPQGLVEALTIQAGLLRNPAHAARPRNDTKRVKHEICVAGFERLRR